MSTLDRLKDWIKNPSSQTDTMPPILHWNLFEDDWQEIAATVDKLLTLFDAAKRQVDQFPEDCQEDLINAVWEFNEEPK